jgi:hypothetical protein
MVMAQTRSGHSGNEMNKLTDSEIRPITFGGMKET